MKITMIQSFATPGGHLYQAGKEYEVDPAFGASLVKTNTAAESTADKPARVVSDRVQESQAIHAATPGKDREPMDKPKSAKV